MRAQETEVHPGQRSHMVVWSPFGGLI